MNDQQEKPENEETTEPSGMKRWLKRIGVAGFLFFTIKGIIWLLVFFGLFELLGC